MDKINNSTNPELVVATTSADGKHKFYAYKNPLKVSALRGIAAEQAKRFAAMCITKDTAFQLIKEMKKAVNAEQDFVKAFAMMQEFEFRLEMICEESSILELVKLYYFLEDEHPDIPSEEHNKRKSEIIKDHPELKAFFLEIGIILLDRFSMKSDEDVLLYLERTRNIAQRIQNYLQ